jgi:hypothetical protein
MSWHAKLLLQMVGIEPESATEHEISLAEWCLETCYYQDLAAEQFQRLYRRLR